MLANKIISVILSAQIAWALTPTEDKFLSSEVLDYFDEISMDGSGEIVTSGFQKREASEVSNEDKQYAFLFAPMNLTRANHYWTRKRGRERTTLPPYYYYYNYYPTRRPIPNSYNFGLSRKKRATMEAFLQRLNFVSSRAKRANTEVPAEAEDSIEKGEVKSADQIPKPMKVGRPGREKNFDKKLGRRL